MYRRVIYDFIWFRDAREGFEVFGDVLVLSVKGADQNWLLLFYGEIPQEEKKLRSGTIAGLCFRTKAKKQILRKGERLKR